MNNKLRQLIDSIAQPDGVAASAASAHLDQLTKPPGSLGKLESVAIKLAGITGVDKPEFDRKTVMVMAADHGVCEEESVPFRLRLHSKCCITCCQVARQLMCWHAMRAQMSRW